MDTPSAFNTSFYKMSEEVELDSSATRLKVSTTLLDIYETNGSDERATVDIVPFGTSKSTAKKGFKSVPDQLVGQYLSPSSKLSREAIAEIENAVITELQSLGIYKKYSFPDHFYFANLYNQHGPFQIFRGPYNGTMVFASGPSARSPQTSRGVLMLVDFRTDHFQGNVHDHTWSSSAWQPLPTGYSVDSIKFSDMRLVATSKDGQQLTLAYDLATRGPQLRRPNRFETFMDGILDLSVFRDLQKIATFKEDYDHINMFTGPYIQKIDDLIFGIFNRDGQSFLRVLDATSNVIIFEQGLGKELVTGSQSDPYASDNVHRYPYGVKNLFKAPQTAAYTKAGIEYVVLLTDGTVYTLNLAKGN
jgi:hypothetical protein